MSLNKNKFLAAALSALIFTAATPFSIVRAEEGMFMMDKVASLPLQQKGLKISPTEIYNPAGGGLSEAVVSLSIGCTGEFVSPDGLILTNHHCGYDALVAASTQQNNYGEVGYKADSREQELPAAGYSVNLTLKSEDVTAQIANNLNLSDAAAVKARVDEYQKQEQAKAPENVKIVVQALNGGLYFYKFQTMTVSDVRVVYAPPKNIGFYGGDPDNFEWTRHCGDFTFMRAYVGKNGKAAAYSKENVPYKPKKFLTISTDGLKENDFSMVIGYPGGTNRYRESVSVAYNQDERLPFLVDYLTAQIDALKAVGAGNPAKRVALQAEIFSLSNSQKAFDGGVAALRRANVVGQKQADEAKFQTWIAADPARQTKYGSVLNGLKTAYEDLRKTGKRDDVLQYILNVAPLGYAFAAVSGQAGKTALQEGAAEVLKSEPAANREMLKFFLRRAADLPANQKIAAVEKRFGNLQGEARVRAEDEFARLAVENQTFTTQAGLTALANTPIENLRSSQEPLISFAAEIAPEIPAVFARQGAFNAAVSKYRLPYVQGIAEMKGTTPYPDANFTQRFTYGAVKGYQPKEAVNFSPFTTLDGIFEKDTGREPFNAPAKLRQLWQSKNYGVYNTNGTIPVDYLTTNDIIGGNSGSPALNARGEQVGIVFDGNYEGLGNDFFFSPALGRTIVVDIRYVLFLTDKFGDAGWILKEMNIKGKAAGATAKS